MPSNFNKTLKKIRTKPSNTVEQGSAFEKISKIYNQDCLKTMSEIGSEKVDLILTDPPYNLGLFMKNRETNINAMRSNHFAGSGWDDLNFDIWKDYMLKFLFLASKTLKKKGNLLIFMSLIKAETIIELASRAGLYYKTTGIWHKTNPMPRNMNLHFINSTEAWIHFTSKSKTGIFNNNNKALHDFIETSNIKRSEKKEGAHPTQKPLEILSFFIKTLSNKKGLVVDPFMGSGSTGFASINNDRKFIGGEIKKKYFEISKKRLENSNSQFELF